MNASKGEVTVLVVDDDEDIRLAMSDTLEAEGYAVLLAENGLDALAKLRASSALPNLILLDLMMPEMDGFEFITELRRHDEWRSIPVVVITARDLTADDHRRLNGYVAATVQKSAYSREDMVAEVRDLLATSVHHPATRREA